MNYKPDEATLISFLYGELGSDEQKLVEEYLSTHPDEKKRIEEWSFTRSAMTRLQDKEVIAPPIILDDGGRRPVWKESYFRIPLGMAASLLVVLAGARLLGLSASYSGNELTIGFGTKPPAVQPLTVKQVGSMIRTSLAENNDALQAGWKADQKALEESVQKNLGSNSRKMDKLMETASTANEDQVRRFVSQMQSDNLKLMKDYLQLSSEGQKAYIETLLVDFSKYLQEQRKQDLQLFQTRMNSIQENNDQFKQETEQILTGLITRSGSSNQNKN